MRNFIFIFLTLLHSGLIKAQKTMFYCSYYGDAISSKIINNTIPIRTENSFSSNQEAIEAVNKILRPTGLQRNFIVQPSSDVGNAAAITQGSTRFVLYNIAFMKMVAQTTKTNWGAVSIMAHEIGHHLNGHTLDGLGSQPKKELEADEFSGFILRKLGASLQDAQIAMNSMASEQDSPTHPGRFKRLNAIAKGWAEADGESNIPTKTIDKKEAISRTNTPVGDALNFVSLINKKSFFEERYVDLVTYKMSCEVINNSDNNIEIFLEFPYGYYRNCDKNPSNFVEEDNRQKRIVLSPDQSRVVEIITPAIDSKNRCGGAYSEAIRISSAKFIK